MYLIELIINKTNQNLQMQVASIDNTDSPEQQPRVTSTGTASEEKKATPEAANDTS